MKTHEKIQLYVETAISEGRAERYYANTITWMLVTELDGWISLFRWYENGWSAVIQAANYEKAVEWAERTEPLAVPMAPLICS